MPNKIPKPGSPPLRSACRAKVNAVPHPYMASAAIAGLPKRLVQRSDVRHEPTAASAAAASAAAAGPERRRRGEKENFSPPRDGFVPRGGAGETPGTAPQLAPPPRLRDWRP